MNGLKSLVSLILVGALALALGLHLGADSSHPHPVLMNTCLITTDVNRCCPSKGDDAMNLGVIRARQEVTLAR
jgi:hypothetical protein